METLTAIATRKSVRAYLPEQISKDNLNTILGAGSSAPVALGDYGNVHFTVVQDKATLSMLADGDEKPFYGAPTLVLISAKATPYPNIEYFNTGCILQNMFITATALGLGSTFISGASEVAQSNPDTLATLNLPQGYTPVAAAALGYAKTPLQETAGFKNKVSINQI
ncbi:MAG: nitroreductase family protein [Christensenellaceae bacterium]|jgi:nitroreductase